MESKILLSNSKPNVPRRPRGGGLKPGRLKFKSLPAFLFHSLRQFVLGTMASPPAPLATADARATVPDGGAFAQVRAAHRLGLAGCCCRRDPAAPLPPPPVGRVVAVVACASTTRGRRRGGRASRRRGMIEQTPARRGGRRRGRRG